MSKQPSTLILSCRIELRTLAALAKWFCDRDNRPPTKSAIVDFALNTLLQALEANGEIQRPETDSEAFNYLATLYDNLISKRNQPRLLVAITQDALSTVKNEVESTNNRQKEIEALLGGQENEHS